MRMWEWKAPGVPLNIYIHPCGEVVRDRVGDPECCPRNLVTLVVGGRASCGSGYGYTYTACATCTRSKV